MRRGKEQEEEEEGGVERGKGERERVTLPVTITPQVNEIARTSPLTFSSLPSSSAPLSPTTRTRGWRRVPTIDLLVSPCPPLSYPFISLFLHLIFFPISSPSTPYLSVAPLVFILYPFYHIIIFYPPSLLYLISFFFEC